MRKKKSKSTGDVLSRIVKPPAKMAKKFDILRNTMGPEVEAIGYGSAKPTEVPTAQNRPHGKSPLVDTLFNSYHFVNTNSFTPLQPTLIPYVSIPFGTISNPKENKLLYLKQ